MFDAIVFVKALVVGLSVAAPVGPIGLLTIQRTIDRGFRMGLATGFALWQVAIAVRVWL